jgi:hypothetical protein
MNEFEHWLDDDPPAEVRRLLTAARSRQPSSALVGRTLAAVGLMGGLSTLGSDAVAAGGKAVALTAGLKWGLAGTVTGAALIVAVASTRQPPPPDGPPPVRAVSVNAPAPAPVPRGPSYVPPAEPPLPAAPTRLSKPSAQRTPGSLMDAQLAYIDRARSALKAGDPRTALKQLDLCDRGFVERNFGPEVLSLRMRAKAGLGDHAAAERIARVIADRYPHSPQARQAESLLARPADED